MTDREEFARAAFEDALAMYLELPDVALGRIVVHVGGNGSFKGAVEMQLPAKLLGGPRVSHPPKRFGMPSNGQR